MWAPKSFFLLLALGGQLVLGARLLAGTDGGGGSSGRPHAATTLPAYAVEGLVGEPPTESGLTMETKIVNGEAVNSTDFDFMAALFANNRFFCGGVLLSSDSVLTAAHCVVDTQLVATPSSLTVWLLGKRFAVDRIFSHPGYSADTIPEDNKDLSFEGALHDIALLKLVEEAAGLPTVELATADTQLAEGGRLQAAGWGKTESGEVSSVLKFADVNFLPPAYCPSDYTDVMCAGGTGENTCNGDSGGPLLQRDAATRKATVVGVTSHGPDCLAGPSYAYGYYTDVRQYLDVIATWLAGQEYEWSGDDSSSGSDDTRGGTSSTFDGSDGGSGGGNGTVLPPNWQPDATVWQPVPGWPADWPTGGAGSGAGATSSDGTGGGSVWGSIDELWCNLLPSTCNS